MYFLVVWWETVVDVPEVIDENGDVVTPAQTSDQVSRMKLLMDPVTVAQAVSNPMVDAFEIEAQANRQSLQSFKLRIKAGPRTTVTKEVEVLEDTTGREVSTREV